MAKLFTYLALFCLAATILADDCNNPLLTTFGFTSLGTPTSVSGLKYCKTLQTSLSCCSADTINSIQEKAEAFGKKLSDIVAARDKAIVETRDQIIPGLQTSIQQFQENAAKAMTKMMEQLTGSLGNLGNLGGMGGISINMSEITGSMPFSSEMTAGIATAMANMTTAITSNLPEIRSGFKDFQKQRSPCVVELLKLQSAAWCLACDPAWATKGVTSDDVALSTNVCQRVQSACYKFVVESAAQSAVLALKTVGPMIGQMATLMGNIANLGMQGASGAAESLETMFAGSGTTYNASNSTMRPVEVPSGCTEGNCAWICSSMFSNGQIDPNAITAGGVQSNTTDPFSSSGTRLLAQEEEKEEEVVRKLLNKRGRALAANEWDPAQDEAGVTITFSDDPANVSAGLIKAGMICLLAMIAAFVF